MRQTVQRYPYSLDEPLLWLTPRNPWTIRDACEGTQILGDMGSGKTSGSGRALALAFLRAGFGGLVLTKKTDECARWSEYLAEAGRLDSRLIVHPREPWRFNFLDYQFRRAGEAAGYVENAVNLFMNVIENRREGSGQSARNDQRFFIDGVRRLIRYSMEALLLAGEAVTMDHLKNILAAVPYPHPQTGERVWPTNSFLADSLGKAIYRHRHGMNTDAGTTTAPEEIKAYFENEFARPGTDRQSAGILSTFTGMADPFLSGPVKELFCATTNFIPEFSRRGAVIILNLPTDEWEEIGRTAQLTFKYIWQRAMLRRQGLGAPGDVPVFLWADEAQTFTTSMDKAFQEAARSSVACTVFLTQNINNYLAAFHDNAEAQAYGLLAGLGTKIFHRNGDHTTNQWAAETIAKGITARLSGGFSESTGRSYNVNSGSNSSGSSGSGGPSSSSGYSSGSSSGYSRQTSANEGWQEQVDFQVQPELFTRLKSGGPQNRYEVQAVVFKSGAAFTTTSRPYTGVTFRQR